MRDLWQHHAENNESVATDSKASGEDADHASTDPGALPRPRTGFRWSEPGLPQGLPLLQGGDRLQEHRVGQGAAGPAKRRQEVHENVSEMGNLRLFDMMFLWLDYFIYMRFLLARLQLLSINLTKILFRKDVFFLTVEKWPFILWLDFKDMFCKQNLTDLLYSVHTI